MASVGEREAKAARAEFGRLRPHEIVDRPAFVAGNCGPGGLKPDDRDAVRFAGDAGDRVESVRVRRVASLEKAFRLELRPRTRPPPSHRSLRAARDQRRAESECKSEANFTEHPVAVARAKSPKPGRNRRASTARRAAFQFATQVFRVDRLVQDDEAAGVHFRDSLDGGIPG